MLSVVRNWLKPPVFAGDENETRVALTDGAPLIAAFSSLDVF